jgi:hypothetical protein
MPRTKAAPAPAPAPAPVSELREPTLTQKLMLDAPFGDDLCIISARGTGKSFGICFLLARDAAHFKDRFAALVTRQTYQGLTELQGLRIGHRHGCPLTPAPLISNDLKEEGDQKQRQTERPEQEEKNKTPDPTQTATAQPLISESSVHPHPAADVLPEALKAHRSTLQLVSWPCFPAGRKVNPYLAKAVPRGLAPTRSWTWEVGSSQLFLAAFIRKERRPSRWETAAATSCSSVLVTGMA